MFLAAVGRRVFVAILNTVVVTHVLAQTVGGTISGTVTDQQGSVVPAASAKLKNIETGVITAVMTNHEGMYRAANLRLQEGRRDF